MEKFIQTNNFLTCKLPYLDTCHAVFLGYYGFDQMANSSINSLFVSSPFLFFFCCIKIQCSTINQCKKGKVLRNLCCVIKSPNLEKCNSLIATSVAPICSNF